MELKYYLRGLGLGIIVTAIIMGVATSGKRTMTDAEIIARAKQLGMIEDRVLSESVAGKEGASDEQNLSGVHGVSTDDTPNVSSDDTPNVSSDDTPDDSSNDISDDLSDAQQGADTSGVRQVIQPEAAGAAGEDSRVNTITEPEGGSENADPEREDEAENADENTEAAQDDGQGGFFVSDAPMVITIGSGDGSYAVSKKLADIGAISSPENFDTFLCQNGYDKKIRTGTYTIPADASDEQMARIITGAE